MSRSYRKPYMTVGGVCSAKRDKVFAHRGERRKNNRVLYKAMKEDRLEEYEPLHRRECPHNNVYDWIRDGKVRYQTLDNPDWCRYLAALDPENHPYGFCGVRYRDDFWTKYYSQWPPEWYVDLLRK